MLRPWRGCRVNLNRVLKRLPAAGHRPEPVMLSPPAAQTRGMQMPVEHRPLRERVMHKFQAEQILRTQLPAEVRLPLVRAMLKHRVEQILPTQI